MATNFNRVIKGYLEIFGSTLHGPVQVDERGHCEGGRPFWTTRSLPTKNEISIKLKWNSRARKSATVRMIWGSSIYPWRTVTEWKLCARFSTYSSASNYRIEGNRAIERSAIFQGRPLAPDVRRWAEPPRRKQDVADRSIGETFCAFRARASVAGSCRCFRVPPGRSAAVVDHEGLLAVEALQAGSTHA